MAQGNLFPDGAGAVRLQAHAKINWGLNIVGRRPDGYHLLDMLMQSIALCDDLTIEPAEELSLTVNGTVPLDAEQNLVMRAARKLQAEYGVRCGARMALTKRIPARAGLGGGSADGAAALLALAELWGIEEGEDLLRLGLALGADVPFCMMGGLARVSGIGEIVEPVQGAPELPLVLVTPGGGLSTAEVFRLWDNGSWPETPLDTAALGEALYRRDLKAVDALSANALTAPALALMPEIGEAMARLRALGAGAVFMSGSGSTVVGAFDDETKARGAAESLPGALLTKTKA